MISAQCFDGDLFVGLKDVIEILRKETIAILESALGWNKYLYSVHVIVVITRTRVSRLWCLFTSLLQL